MKNDKKDEEIIRLNRILATLEAENKELQKAIMKLELEQASARRERDF